MKTRHYTLVTPEGVPLDFVVPPLGERLAAFLLDSLIIGLASFVLLLAPLAFQVAEGWALFNLLSFVIRMFYFPWFEHRWQGRTPGKRWQKLHVIDCDGRALPVGAVLARNLTREVEFILPLQVLLVLPVMVATPGALWIWFAALWLVGLMCVPLLQRYRRRVGDLIAGTLVVRKPAVELLGDLAAAPPGRSVTVSSDQAEAEAVSAPVDLVFTPAQLAHYGEYELEVLERLLRRPATKENRQAFAGVRRRVEAKIGWAGDPVDDLIFLKAFYTAQRGALEHRLLMGRRRKDKHDPDAT